MSNVQNLSRRDFIKRTGATTALVLGAHLAPHSLIRGTKAAGDAAQPNLPQRAFSFAYH